MFYYLGAKWMAINTEVTRRYKETSDLRLEIGENYT